jgi:hypothetical protein|tara:strand:- start:856 stop:1389 length:534 start_codon:yes stop_codon:yes gene_type:complete
MALTLYPTNLLHLCDDIQEKIGKEIKCIRIQKDAKKRKQFINEIFQYTSFLHTREDLHYRFPYYRNRELQDLACILGEKGDELLGEHNVALGMSELMNKIKHNLNFRMDQKRLYNRDIIKNWNIFKDYCFDIVEFYTGSYLLGSKMETGRYTTYLMDMWTELDEEDSSDEDSSDEED